MKKFHLSLCLGALTLLFSACSVSQLSNIGSNKELLVNESLPKMKLKSQKSKEKAKVILAYFKAF